MDKILNYINGKYVPSADDNTYQLFNPVNGDLTAEVHEATQAQVDEAVQAAHDALHGPWGQMTVDARSKMLMAVAEGIRERFDDFVEAEMLDTGQPRHVMEKAFVPRGAANIEHFAELYKTVSSETFELDTSDGTALNYALRRPKGVIAIVCPWNAPFLLMTWKLGPALACGSTVVVKPSEQTPRTAVLLGEVMNAVGVPAGVYNVVNGFGPDSTGEFLTTNPDVDAITFTGETRTGTAIMQAAAVGIRDVSFELGGKNSAIVFADCDLDKAVDGVFRSAFLNTGQVCLGTERVYVERAIFDEFRDRLADKARSVTYGPPTDHDTTYGPLISKEHQEKVLGYYQQAVDQGVTVVVGGGVPDVSPELAGGNWVEPTMWVDAPADAAILHEEIFGPCCHLTAFDDAAEAIQGINNTPYGLATTIWTENLSTAHTTAAAIDVGVAWVNSWFLRDLRTPFGGAKQSGIGREGGVHSLEFYTETKNVCIQY